MTDNKEMVELNNEELKKVSGGGSGTIPKSGIMFATYHWLSEGYYYSRSQNTDDVAYVYRNLGGDLYYTKESFVCSGSTWQSTKVLGPIEIEDETKFKSDYPYIMNVRP